jgi:hypothetical protein
LQALEFFDSTGSGEVGAAKMSLVLGQANPAKDTTDVSSKIRDLKAERVKVLERGMELVSVAYAEGSRDFTCVFSLQLELLDAKLDAAESKEEEIAVLSSLLKVAIIWRTPSIGQEKSLPRDYIAKQEQMLREVEQSGMGADKDGEESAQLANLRKQLAELVEESESTDGVEIETRRNFWNSALSFLFEGQAEAVQDYRRLVAVLAEAQYRRALDPLQWKIVDVHLKRIAAAAENRRLAQSQFDVGYQNLDLQKHTIEECFDVGIRFSESLFDTMPPVGENLAQRLLIASRLHTVRAAYHDSLSIWSNICHRLKMGLPGGRPDIEASSRVLVYHWQARVYEFQCELKKLRN